ncbi:MAG: ABC transporter permease [Holosporaceae bacterium]
MTFRSRFAPLLPGLLFLLLWQLVVGDSERLKFLFASPILILQVALLEMQQAAIWWDCWITLSEALLGLVFGTVLGTSLGILLWSDRRIDRIARPYIIVIGSIPVFALAPIMIVWFGTGLLSKAIMAGFAVFFVSLVQAYEGATIAAEHHINLANSLKATRYRVIRKIVIPGSLRWVIAGFRMNVGFALMGAFIGEFVSSEAGIGHYILKSSSLYDMPRVFLGLLLISIMALLLTFMAKVMQRFHCVATINRGA